MHHFTASLPTTHPPENLLSNEEFLNVLMEFLCSNTLSLYIGSYITKHFVTWIHRKLCSGFSQCQFIVESTYDFFKKAMGLIHSHNSVIHSIAKYWAAYTK